MPDSLTQAAYMSETEHTLPGTENSHIYEQILLVQPSPLLSFVLFGILAVDELFRHPDPGLVSKDILRNFECNK